MKLKPKIFFGILVSAFVFFIISLVILNIPKTQISSFRLEALQDRFKTSLDIKNQDEKAFSSFLSNLNLDNQKKDFEFKLDATSSAALAFITPVNVDIKISSKEIEMVGETSLFVKENESTKQIRLPKSTLIAIYGQNLTAFLKSNLKLKDDSFLNNIPNWQYLIIFNKKDFVYAFNATGDNFEKVTNSLKQQKEYIEETDEDTTFHLFKEPENETSTIAAFKDSELGFIASSKEAAEDFIKAEGDEFPKQTKTSFNLEYFENENPNIGETMMLILKPTTSSTDEKNLYNRLSKIKKASFSLNGKTISGLISLK